MNWHSRTVRGADLPSLLSRIRLAGGTVVSSKPGADGVTLIWTTASDTESDRHRLVP
jgi:hypothetical protein